MVLARPRPEERYELLGFSGRGLTIPLLLQLLFGIS
jgi:hypothetical protein